MRRGRLIALLLGLLTATAVGQEELEALVDRLGSDEASVRSAAYRELQQRRDPQLASVLGPRLATMPRHSRNLAVALLRVQSAQAPDGAFHDMMRAEQPFVRAVGAAILATWRYRAPGESPTRDLDAVGTLVEALTVMPEADRIDVIGPMSGIEDARVPERLRAWLHPEAKSGLVNSVLRDLLRREGGSSEATRSAAAALAEAAESDVRALALAYLARDDVEHGAALATLLKRRPASFWLVRDLLAVDRPLGPALVEAITSALRAPRAKHDIAPTAALLRRQSPGSAVAELRGLLRHDNADFRAAAFEALVDLPGGLDDKDLHAILAGDDVETRLIAAEALRQRDDPSGLSIVLELLPRAGKHKATATRVLAGFRDRRIAPRLLDLLDDGEAGVRSHAWTGLQALMRGLFPYRRFDFQACGYDPHAPSRTAGIAALRAWWAAVE